MYAPLVFGRDAPEEDGGPARVHVSVDPLRPSPECPLERLLRFHVLHQPFAALEVVPPVACSMHIRCYAPKQSSYRHVRVRENEIGWCVHYSRPHLAAVRPPVAGVEHHDVGTQPSAFFCRELVEP